MNPLRERLLHRPALLAEILIATFFISVLNLAMPIFVIAILNRFMTYGLSSTLITLTSGMCIAVFCQTLFRVIRTRIMGEALQPADTKLENRVNDIIIHARPGILGQMATSRIQEMATHVKTIQQAFNAQSLTSVIELPFTLLYLGAVFLLHPGLGTIALAGSIAAFITGIWFRLKTDKAADFFQQGDIRQRQLLQSAIHGIDTLRVLNFSNWVKGVLLSGASETSKGRRYGTDIRERSESFMAATHMITSAILYASGALFVVNGTLSIGALIGANILASRGLQNISRFVQAMMTIGKSRRAQADITAFLNIPKETEGGTRADLKGRITFADVGYAWQGSGIPLFESLSLDLSPGNICVVRGHNGAGKTTFARLVMGLLPPNRGDIRFDGVNISQLNMQSVRDGIIYFPQEPTFMAATLRENLIAGRENISEEHIRSVLTTVGLETWIKHHPTGLDAFMPDAGSRLSLGIRRRLALARAILSPGAVAVFDDPTEGLDTEGMACLYKLMNDLAKAQKTLIIMTNDPFILKGADVVVDLNTKPEPAVIRTGKEVAP